MIQNKTIKSKPPKDQDPLHFNFTIKTIVDDFDFKVISSLLPFLVN